MPLAGLIDIDQEIARLEKELAVLNYEVERVEKKLANEGFVDEGACEIVEEERAKDAGLYGQERPGPGAD